MTRRQFSMTCAVGAAGILSTRMTLAQSFSSSTVSLSAGGHTPALGMGSWRLGQGRHPVAQEEEALKLGISLGMSLIDTAEMYGDGASERLIGGVIANRRDNVFLVSKVLPSNATSENGIRQACAASLRRLGTRYLDLYLLHWRDGITDLSIVVETFEALRAEGQIRRWGVSNFGVPDMEDLFHIKGGKACATNQVRYSLDDRSIEADLIPWSTRHDLPIMAYSPLGSGSGLLRNPVIAQVAARHGVAPATVAIAWTMRNGKTISIPESGTPAHIRENVGAMRLTLEDRDLSELDREFPV